MKRRNFLKVLTAAAATAALPARVLRDILIHTGNPMTHDGTDFKIFSGACRLYEYQHEALRQMNLYQHASRVVLSAPRQQGKTYFLQLGNAYHSEIEKRVFAMINTKQKRA